MQAKLMSIGLICACAMLLAGCAITADKAAPPTAPGVGPVAAMPVPANFAMHDAATLYVPRPGTGGELTLAENPQSEASANDAVWQRMIASQVPLITGRANLVATLRDVDAPTRKTVWYTSLKSYDAGLTWLGTHIHAEQIPQTALISVWLDGDLDPKDAATILNDVVDHFLDSGLRRQNQKLRDNKNFYDVMRTRYQAQISRLRLDTAETAARLQLNGGGMPNGVSQREQELIMLVGEKLKAEAELSTAQAMQESARKQAEAGTPLAAVEMKLADDPQLSQLRTQVITLDVQIAAMESRDPKPVEYAGAVELRKATQNKLDALVEQARAKQSAQYLQTLADRVDAATRARELFMAQMEKCRTDLADISARLADYVSKKDEQAITEQLARRIQQQLDLINTALTIVDTGQTIIISRAGG